ncbi:MAG TPA: hypothetical protein VEJ00_03295 [Candidatus Acidoferrales bacterium]|nr:hypothetical protein [Candidatus Acidoferrales bacterium]
MLVIPHDFLGAAGVEDWQRVHALKYVSQLAQQEVTFALFL